MYQQPREFFWWTKQPGYLLYMAREVTGVLMAIYLIDWLIGAPPGKIVSILGLIGALGHGLNWVWLSAKLPDLPITSAQRGFLFLFFFTAWLGVSYLIYLYLYV